MKLSRFFPFAFGLVALVACGAAASRTSSNDAGDVRVGDGATRARACAERKDGALVTFEMAGDPSGGARRETFTIWSTNRPFIDEAIRLKRAGEQQVPVFERVIEGTACDAGRRWHVDPQAMRFASATMEICDGRPSYVDANLDAWMAHAKSYCPWGARVIEVDDRRARR